MAHELGGRLPQRRTRLLLDVVEGAPFVSQPLQNRVVDVALLLVAETTPWVS